MNVVLSLLFLLMWSSGAIFVKLGLMSSSVWTFLAIRSAGAMLVLAAILVVVFRSDFWTALSLPLRTILGAVFVGLLLQAGYQGSYFLAIAHDLSPGALTIILGAQPLLMPWLAGERTHWVGKALLLAGFLGLALAVMGARELGAGGISGILFGMGALACITVGTTLQKRIGVPVAQSILWQYIGSVVVFTATVIATGWHATLNLSFLASAAWMILVVSVGRKRAASIHAVSTPNVEDRSSLLLRASCHNDRRAFYLRYAPQLTNRHRRGDCRVVLAGLRQPGFPATPSWFSLSKFERAPFAPETSRRPSAIP
jgi:drug/metabolite transporter (DMT)-like permease